MEKTEYLKKIHNPYDLKQLDNDELTYLAAEIRTYLIDVVSKTGGHLASNLGVVELTIALHKVFSSPHDKIIWDVGHQAYVHKLLTGRADRFPSLRTDGGISGFPRPEESEHDIFAGGHSSTSISAALGIAQANKIKGNKHYAIAVIGDGALTGGMVYEAMNNIAKTSTRLIVILNNNEMSISQNVGRLAEHLAAIKSKPGYFRMKAKTESTLNRIPLIGKKLSAGIFILKTAIKNFIYSSTVFEKFGMRYMGPIDGHDIAKLCDALQGAKEANFPILLHVNTTKGKGYDYAEKNPTQYHGISKFDIDSGEPISSGPNFSSNFGEYLVEAAAKDKRICAVTAAMTTGTGLLNFAEAYPNRFFDVGIAEQHAVTFSLGLSKAGMLPVFAVYSAFLQRAYDQLVHDGTLQKQKIVLAIDRAGFVGDDGEMHHGLLDVPLLNTIPDMTIYSPSSFDDMRNCFYKAFYHETGVVAVRYHRGCERALPEDYSPTYGAYELYGDNSAKYAIITYGRLFSYACEAIEELKNHKINCKIVKLNRIKPIDKNAVLSVHKCENLFFFEESERSGGIGESFLESLSEIGFSNTYTLTAVNDCYIRHASVDKLLNENKLDAEGMIEIISKMINKDDVNAPKS